MTAPDKLGPYLAGTLAAFVVFLAFNIRSARYYRRLPPGPKALPLIGNLVCDSAIHCSKSLTSVHCSWTFRARRSG
jgi:hypothetical protein